jgi:3-methyladenine DNA glycosylase/8-oxoguanine DNA glycosylase
MEPAARLRIEVTAPLDLRLTLGALGSGPAMRFHGREAWRATSTPEGPATIHAVQVDGYIEVEAWGEGAAWAAARAATFCGLEDDDTGFLPVHPMLVEVKRRHPGLRLPKTGSVFEALVPFVIGQKVTSTEAHRSYWALVEALGQPAPGPARLTIPPPAPVLASTPYWKFHQFGIERRRAEVIITAARSARRLEEAVAMNLDDARRRIDAFPGIGPWTTAKTSLVALGDPDAVPVGDYHLPHSVGYALEGTVRSNDERMLELLAPYAGHRARAIRLIGIAGVVAPRFGPRMPIRDIRRS